MKNMEITVPTITETKKEIIIRIPKQWKAGSSGLGVADLLQVVHDGEGEFRAGKTRAFEQFLREKYPSYAKIPKRSR